MIEKIQNKTDAYRIHMFYYKRARDAMYDAVRQLLDKGYEDIFIPGYIGWSRREGSGIFDPLNSLSNLTRHYYKVNKELAIDIESLNDSLKQYSILLVVNYFGFRDKDIGEVLTLAKSKNCIVVEDNAHGFYTYFCNGSVGADVTFFSLHKMFPFNKGGGLLIENDDLGLTVTSSIPEPVPFNPFVYHINEIAKIRKSNFINLIKLMDGNKDYFVPLRGIQDIENNVPQTFPIVIKKGDRNKIYEIMNASGFGVVSLYHTMIEELRNGNHEDACWLSEKVMNLPLHQDVNPDEYEEMIERLIRACEESEGGSVS